MTSIFDLKTNVNELSSSNEGTSKMQYDQHPPTRDVVGDSFANGAIHFRFQTSGEKWWIPSKSFLRMRCSLTKGDGTPLVSSDGVAPNMSMMANLFQSAEIRINDKVVSRIADFLPQVDAVEQRLTKSSSWLDSIGEATNWWQTDANLRIAEVSSDGALTEVETKDADFNSYTDATTVTYVAQSGLITFGGPGEVTQDGWKVGDFILMTGGGVNLGNGALGVRAEVTDTNNDQTMTVRAEYPVNIAASAAIRFSRIRPNPSNTPDARNIPSFEITWTPPLSLFKIGHALPSGKYELVLNPQTSNSYQKRAIESVLDDKVPFVSATALGNFRFSVVDFYLYVNTVEGPRADNITYLLDLEQTRCQSEKIDNVNFQQKNFDVSPSSYALTVAYQDLRAGNNTLYSPSKFKSYGEGPNSRVSQDLKLKRFFINYAGQNLPAPDADPSFIAGTDYTIQRYTETQIYSGAYFDTGGAEKIEDFHNRGAYYYFSWPKDGTDRSTRVNVHQQFEDATEVNNLRCLLFDHSRQVARIRVQDGRVTDVQLEDS